MKIQFLFLFAGLLPEVGLATGRQCRDAHDHVWSKGPAGLFQALKKHALPTC